jgi:hypothetical protein
MPDVKRVEDPDAYGDNATWLSKVKSELGRSSGVDLIDPKTGERIVNGFKRRSHMSDVKIVESPDAYPGNGPAWLFENKTPEQIKAMQQTASDEALETEIETETPSGFDYIDPQTGKVIKDGFTPTS